MGICDICGYETPKDYEYFLSEGTAKEACLCEDCHGNVDFELMDAFGVTFKSITAGFDDVDYENDDLNF